MPTSSLIFSQYYMAPEPQMPSHPYSSMHMHQQDQHISHSMHPPPSPSIPIDPALALYPPSYYPQYHPQHQIPQQLSLAASLSSPSSQASDSISTPPTEQMLSGPVKRSSSSNANETDSRKRARKDDDNDAGPSTEKAETKAKPTRGSRVLLASGVSREIMNVFSRSQIAGNGHPSEYIHLEILSMHIFSPSTRKHELLTRSLRKMERTLDTVLRSIGNPSLVSGMVSRSPSPSAQLVETQNLLSQGDPTTLPSVPAYQPSRSQQSGSPKLHSLPDNSLNPLGLLAEASLANRRTQAVTKSARPSSQPLQSTAMGVASDTYFKPGPMTILPLRRLFIERQVQPEMLSFVTTDEVVALFDIYFTHMSMHANLLDPEFHTPALVCSRSPFLLTTICAISSKHYTARPELHAKLTDLSKRLAFSVPAQGYKSVEIVQAYLLLVLWGCGPVERYEQDKTWFLLGMAIRMATDLNLHRKTATTSTGTEEGKARDREVHNRERTWLLCFALDRSVGAQMGKPFSIKEDSIIRNALRWIDSPFASRHDFALAAYVELQRIMSRSLESLYSGTDSPSGLLTDCDYMLIIKTMDQQIQTWYSQVSETDFDGLDDAPAEYARHMSVFYANYAMLVINSFGLQNALDRTPINIPHFFARVHTSAKTCALVIRDELGPRGFLKYSPDSHFVFGSYAVLSLLKLIRPEFPASRDIEEETLGLVRDVADTFDNVSVGPLHTPALYSVFLRALLLAKTDPPPENSGDADLQVNGHGPILTGGDANVSNGLTTPQDPHQQPSFLLSEFQFASEMGPVADLSTFPPTMAACRTADDSMGMLSMDNILSGGFWDNVLVPGYSNPMEGLSGGFVYGAGGSGFITPHFGGTPAVSGANSPARGVTAEATTHQHISAAFPTP
ncbi:hypothetical protein EW146_g561 [Bondarzewia mesenterica]|uniref:Xylanolytic transcriptional activator regulatory domain-containing protein n=1 Tax=Bondarzewia mesenterica TaxID=1095465 RepID=A0A4S4MCY7_9AGAM|nr:hypothetical protein EW146_g561 [Bondarzewia mesenterica]